MIEIPKAEFRKLLRHYYPGYIAHNIKDHTDHGKTCRKGDWCGFESVITGKPTEGLSLIFEHIHFEIV